MHHPESATAAPVQRWLVRLAYGLAVVLGAIYGYDFGSRIGGMFIGVILALNGAVFCSIVAGAAAERLSRWWLAWHPTAPRSAT
jgi:hypothetical protein